MGRLRAKQDYESIRSARILQNKARLASVGIRRSAEEVPATVVVSLNKSIAKVKSPKSGPATPVRRSSRLTPQDSLVDGGDGSEIESGATDSATPLRRRSNRFKGKSSDSDNLSPQGPNKVEKDHSEIESRTPLRRSKRLKGEYDHPDSSVSDDPLVDEDHSDIESETTVGDPGLQISDYETIRNARITENKARMASLGIDRSISELHDLISSGKSKRGYKKYKPDLSTPLRRSDRLKGKPGDLILDIPSPLVLVERLKTARRSLFSNAYRCSSKARGSVYDRVFGICCHFCRQKKLCGEEDCRRCGDSDMNQPCIGKTECSECHSSQGVLCRACLKVRYGEEMEQVRANENWMCPHCIEEKGINPYWICNSSICLKKRKMVPTGIAIYQAREEGYASVAHLIMDKLKCKEG